MARSEDPRLAEARAKPISDIAARLGLHAALKRASHEWVGPCPACGGRDRFQLNESKGVFLCRHCTPDGGDGIALVRLVLACSLTDALAWLVGDAVVQITPEEQDRRDREAAEKKRRSEQIAARERAKSLAVAEKLWSEGKPAKGTAVQDYMALRGLPDLFDRAPLRALRYHPALTYFAESDRPGEYVGIHTGPAMLASIVTPAGKLSSVHRTWLDLSQPKGKAVILHKGEVEKSKKYRGHVKGCAIRLSSPPGFTTLVMGEGIETTATALCADIPPSAAYWAGADLGNMAGRMVRVPGQKYSGLPALDDPDDDAFVPPPGVTWLIYVQDGDSDPKQTRAKLECGLRRARARVPGLARVSIVHPGRGVDLNDLVMGVEG
jgi:hypothetical protein